MATFKKGDKVHYISCWNRKAKMAIYALTVYSCGKKQMILVDEAGTKFAGTNFKPEEIQNTVFVGVPVVSSIVLKGLTDAEAEAKALEMAAACKVEYIKGWERCIARAIERNQAHMDAYVKAISEDISACEADAVGFVWPNRK